MISYKNKTNKKTKLSKNKKTKLSKNKKTKKIKRGGSGNNISKD